MQHSLERLLDDAYEADNFPRFIKLARRQLRRMKNQSTTSNKQSKSIFWDALKQLDQIQKEKEQAHLLESIAKCKQ